MEKQIYTSYKSLITLSKLLKPHASNIFITDNAIIMENLVKGAQGYFIPRDPRIYQDFLYGYINIRELTNLNTKVTKTKSDIIFSNIDSNNNYYQLTNDEGQIMQIPIFPNKVDIELITKKALDERFDNYCGGRFDDLPNSDFIRFEDKIIDNLRNKELVEFYAGEFPIMISRPFLGEYKKTEYLGFKVIGETSTHITILFKLIEELGNIYTIASFWKI